MATLAATLIQRCRRFMQDWPEGDALTAAIVSTSATTFTVADATIYSAGWLVQIDQEIMVVRSAVGTTVTVLRGARGTTAATHTNGTTILIRPRFGDLVYLDGLNAGLQATFPLIYQPVVDETLASDGFSYEYTIPNLNGLPIPAISGLQFKETGDLTFRDFSAWDVVRGSTPKLKLRRPLPLGTLRVLGFGPIPQLTSTTDTLSTLYPANGENALVMFAAQYLLAASESARVREDTGARDQRENANRPGAALATSNAVYSRFQIALQSAGLPPMPKHAKFAV